MQRRTLVAAVIAWGVFALAAVVWAFGAFPSCTAATCDAASLNGVRVSMVVLGGLIVAATGAYLRFMTR
ncbi:MAG: hypothetical protein WC211_02700 [Dehalococcoidia bacterium]